MNDARPPELAFSSCDRAQETIFSLMEAEPVSETERDALILHLADCEHCRAYQQSMIYLSASMDELGDAPVPAGLEARIMAEVAAQQPAVAQSAPARSQRSVWIKAGPVAAAVLVLAIAIPLVLRNGAPTTQDQGPDVASQASAPVVAMQSGTSDEVILRQASQTVQPIPKTERKTEPETVAPKSEPKGGREQRNQLASSTSSVIAQAPRNVTVSDHVVTGEIEVSSGGVPSVRKAAKAPASASTPASNTVADTSDTDLTQLASAGPLNIQDVYASENESDVYYDPVSTLVGF